MMVVMKQGIIIDFTAYRLARGLAAPIPHFKTLGELAAEIIERERQRGHSKRPDGERGARCEHEKAQKPAQG
jgi:hypothetical protein